MYEILYCLVNTLTLGLSHIIAWFATGGVESAFKLFEKEVSDGVSSGKYKVGWCEDYSLYEKIIVFEKLTAKYLYIGSTIGLILNTITLGIGLWFATIVQMVSGGWKPKALKNVIAESSTSTEIMANALIKMAIKSELIKEV